METENANINNNINKITLVIVPTTKNCSNLLVVYLIVDSTVLTAGEKKHSNG